MRKLARRAAGLRKGLAPAEPGKNRAEGCGDLTMDYPYTPLLAPFLESVITERSPTARRPNRGAPWYGMDVINAQGS